MTSPQRFLPLVQERFSARKFTDQPVSSDDLHYILECARLAPSAVNAQPWRFLVVQSEEGRRKIADCYSREWMASAPLYIVCLNNRAACWHRKFDDRDSADIDIAIAADHIVMAATDLGLGSCWVCAFNPDTFRQHFPQPDGWEAAVIIPIGHIAPDCPRPATRPRKELSEIVEYI
jgi:nitroreductase